MKMEHRWSVDNLPIDSGDSCWVCFKWTYAHGRCAWCLESGAPSLTRARQWDREKSPAVEGS